MPILQMDDALPTYTNNMLWLLRDGAEPVRINQGEAVDMPNTAGSLRWGRPDGAALLRWPADVEEIIWTGKVAVSGFVDVSHILTRDNLDLMVLEVSGHPRPSGGRRLPSRADLSQKPFKRDDFVQETGQERGWYAFLLPLESALSDFAHHALVNGYAVDCYGDLADSATGFDQWLGLPLLLESMTLYSPL